jgi:hypothetical protein
MRFTLSPRRLIHVLLLALVALVVLASPSITAFAQSDSDVAGAMAGLAGAGISLICTGIWFVVAIILVIWVYNDANKRGANGCLWALIVFIGGIFGLLIYLALGRNQPTASA